MKIMYRRILNGGIDRREIVKIGYDDRLTHPRESDPRIVYFAVPTDGGETVASEPEHGSNHSWHYTFEAARDAEIKALNALIDKCESDMVSYRFRISCIEDLTDGGIANDLWLSARGG